MKLKYLLIPAGIYLIYKALIPYDLNQNPNKKEIYKQLNSKEKKEIYEQLNPKAKPDGTRVSIDRYVLDGINWEEVSG